MNNGYILLHRKIMGCRVLQSGKPHSKFEAWVDLLLLANWKDGIIYVRNVKVEIKRGQVGWSELQLAKRWKWSRNKLRRWFDELANEKMIERLSDLVRHQNDPNYGQETEQQTEQQKFKITSIITITNYDRYQNTIQQNGTTDDTTDDTTDGTRIKEGLKKEKKKERGRPKIDWPQKIAAIQSALSKIWNLNRQNYESKYPGLDYELQIQSMLDWVKRKPKVAAEYSDWNLFIQKWLAKEKPSFNFKGNGRCSECNGLGVVDRHIADPQTGQEKIVQMPCQICGRKHGTETNAQ